ncbi:YafY family transcriptional regulator [Demequina sp. TTPB684]|uniref:helix-turn-helix transcriptional regulator n=1 Tax=unclassified Demequina TaxID=2620311 RepID=UPI001CF18AB8|nr:MULTISPECIES: YafY family protein [unclassified Demequina]MCB2412299.1 YafY family transcriptional regulator [Demequina sp. TTPB684]UPU87579.1 YafY family transcriptional regulator [Demequina sp. TMPB413]
MRKDPTGRALQLLSLLQTHRFWRGTELADRLETTERTVRRDVDRLRELGYPVDATSGKFGGYRLASGAHLPPLVLDDDEAVAVAVGLRYAAGAAIDGIEETSLRALTKIEALLPHRLRRRVSALHSSVTSAPVLSDDHVVDPEALSVLAAACRDHEDVRFGYQSSEGEASRRRVAPHQLVTAGRRWYLVAWDHDRADWRMFRLDRIQDPRAVGSHFTPRDIPGGGAAAFVASALGSTPRHVEATLAIDATAAELQGVLRWIDHTPVQTEGDRCVVQIRSEDLGRLTMTVARLALTAPVEVIEPAELADAVRALARHLGGAPR